MMAQRPTLETRIVSALESSRIPVLLGGCGSGRTAVLLGLRERLGSTRSQYIDVERIATTPERFLQALVDVSPFGGSERVTPAPTTAREAFDAAVAFLSTARGSQSSVTFMLDEVLELRTFESFPGLRSVLKDLVAALPQSSNRFVLSTRYVSRARRLLQHLNGAFELIQMPALSQAEVRAAMDGPTQHGDERDREDLARAVHALADGRPAYVRTIIDTMTAMDQGGGSDPISALSALLAPGGQLYASCRFSYELRLHRARGYGALKAILDVLAEQEPLTLTEIALRLKRTPGSTKDYLSWLEDVDLITVRHKRYSYTDPLLRLWVRLHCASVPPTDEDLAREVHMYALARLPQHPQTARVLTGAGKGARVMVDDRSRWGIIEID
jgi:hypothetical protein